MKQSVVFEEIKHKNDIGQEYWSARELFTVLQYLKWDKFLNVIDKAKEACKNSGMAVPTIFPGWRKWFKLVSLFAQEKYTSIEI